MDAASLFGLFRTSILSFLFVSNAMLMDDTAKCPTATDATAACPIATCPMAFCQANQCATVPCPAEPSGTAACSQSKCLATVTLTTAQSNTSQCPLGCCIACASCTDKTSADTTVADTTVADSTVADSTVADNAESSTSFAYWLGQMLTAKPKITARFAVYGVVPEMQLEEVVTCDHKICAGGKCYEVDDAEVEGKPCDEKDTQAIEETLVEESEEPILEAPVAPPLPPSYQFTSTSPETTECDSLDSDPIHRALQNTEVKIPASVLVSLLVTTTEASTRLQMTEELMAERAEFAEQVQKLAVQNAQLQSQLVMMEARQQIQAAEGLAFHAMAQADANATFTSVHGFVQSEGECSTVCVPEARSELTAIQEDLANIRRQIALMKRQQPMPFAPSYVGSSDATFGTATLWRQARVSPYVPVSPVPSVNTAAPSVGDEAVEHGTTRIK